MLNTAVCDGVIRRNPCQVKGAGRVRSTERPIITLTELNAAVVPPRRDFGLPSCWLCAANCGAEK